MAHMIVCSDPGARYFLPSSFVYSALVQQQQKDHLFSLLIRCPSRVAFLVNLFKATSLENAWFFDGQASLFLQSEAPQTHFCCLSWELLVDSMDPKSIHQAPLIFQRLDSSLENQRSFSCMKSDNQSELFTYPLANGQADQRHDKRELPPPFVMVDLCPSHGNPCSPLSEDLYMRASALFQKDGLFLLLHQTQWNAPLQRPGAFTTPFAPLFSHVFNLAPYVRCFLNEHTPGLAPLAVWSAWHAPDSIRNSILHRARQLSTLLPQADCDQQIQEIDLLERAWSLSA